MRRTSVGVAAVALIAAGLAFLADACTAFSSGQLQLYLTDLPIGAEAVDVHFGEIAVRKAQGGTWITVSDTGRSYDLLQLQNTEQILADHGLAQGTYSEIRLAVDSGTITVSGVTHTLQISSSEIIVPMSFVVSANGVTVVVLDFNAGASIKETGTGGFLMRPVIQVKRISF